MSGWKIKVAVSLMDDEDNSKYEGSNTLADLKKEIAIDLLTITNEVVADTVADLLIEDDNGN